MVLTTRQEEFARLVALDAECDQGEAYRRAYGADHWTPKSRREYASRMVRRPAIAERIAELRDQVARAAVVERADVVQALLRLADLAEADGDRATAIRAWELLGKDIGMWRNELRLDVTARHYVVQAPPKIDSAERWAEGVVVDRKDESRRVGHG